MKRLILLITLFVFTGCGIDNSVDPEPQPPPTVTYLDYWYTSFWHYGPSDSITVYVHSRGYGDRIYRWIPAPDTSICPPPAD